MSSNGNGNGKLKVPVTYTSVSVGKEQVSIGISIDHTHVSRETMGEAFVCRQIDCECMTGQAGEQSLPGIEDGRVSFSGDFTSTGYSEKKAGYSTRLAIPKSELDPSDLWDLSGKAGTLIVHGVTALRENGDGGTAAHDPLPGQIDLPEGGDDSGDGRPAEVWDAVPDMDELDRVTIPIEDKHRHEATITVVPFVGGEWAAGWEWSGDGGRDGLECGETGIRRPSQEQAIAAAAGQLVDSMMRADEPKTKAATARRKQAIAACKTFYRDAEHGGATVFETHPA